MIISQRHRHTELWLAETIRQLEHESWLDDKSILREIATGSSERPYTTEALILERGRRLAQSNPIVAMLAKEISRIQPGVRMLSLVAGIIAVICGMIMASAMLSSATVNIMLAWSALLGAHLFTLLLWAVTLATKPSGFTPGILWGSATRRFFSGQHRLPLFRALTTLVSRTRLLFWFYSQLSHGLWTLFYISTTFTLTYHFALYEYAFRWETTLLPAQFFVDFVNFFGWLPQQLGLQMPDAQTVSSLIDIETTRQAWARWILSCVVFYGLAPRAGLTIISRYRTSREMQGLSLDLEQPYYVQLRQRLDRILRPPSIITDPAPSLSNHPHLEPHCSSDHTAALSQGHSLIFAFELHNDVDWPPSDLPAGVVAAGNIASLQERDALMQHLTSTKPQRLVATCDARAGIDRGTLYFLEDIARHANEFRVLLLNQPSARPGRARYWKEELVGLGIREDTIFEELTDALLWLKGHHD